MKRPKFKFRDSTIDSAFNAVLDYIDAQPKSKKVYAGDGLTMRETSNSITLNAKGGESIQDINIQITHPFRVYIEKIEGKWFLMHDIGTLNGFPSNLGEKVLEEIDEESIFGTLNGWVYWDASMDGVSCNEFVVNFTGGSEPPETILPVEKNSIPTEIGGLIAHIDNGRIYQMLRKNLNVKLDLVMQAQSGDGNEVDNFYSLVPYEI